MGTKVGVALNPATSINSIEDILDNIDVILVMTVNHGYAGQKLIPSTIGKIRRLREYLHVHGYDQIAIEVDDNVSFENAGLMKAAGADIFVAGTSSLFTAGTDIYAAGQKLR